MNKKIAILNLINRWGYLSIGQISDLLKFESSIYENRNFSDNVGTLFLQLTELTKSGLLIKERKFRGYAQYFLTNKGRKEIGLSGSGQRTPKVMWWTIEHKRYVIDYLINQDNVKDYYSEKELSRNLKENDIKSKIPDLFISFNDNRGTYYEFELAIKHTKNYLGDKSSKASEEDKSGKIKILDELCSKESKNTGQEINFMWVSDDEKKIARLKSFHFIKGVDSVDDSKNNRKINTWTEPKFEVWKIQGESKWKAK
jgi:hypothetical protein